MWWSAFGITYTKAPKYFNLKDILRKKFKKQWNWLAFPIRLTSHFQTSRARKPTLQYTRLWLAITRCNFPSPAKWNICIQYYNSRESKGPFLRFIQLVCTIPVIVVWILVYKHIHSSTGESNMSYSFIVDENTFNSTICWMRK
jgi:hypothetical protein